MVSSLHKSTVCLAQSLMHELKTDRQVTYEPIKAEGEAKEGKKYSNLIPGLFLKCCMIMTESGCLQDITDDHHIIMRQKNHLQNKIYQHGQLITH